MFERRLMALGLHIAGLAALGYFLSAYRFAGFGIGLLVGVCSGIYVLRKPGNAKSVLVWVWFVLGWGVAFTCWKHHILSQRSTGLGLIDLRDNGFWDRCEIKLGLLGGWIPGLILMGMALIICKIAGWNGTGVSPGHTEPSILWLLKHPNNGAVSKEDGHDL